MVLTILMSLGLRVFSACMAASRAGIASARSLSHSSLMPLATAAASLATASSAATTCKRTRIKMKTFLKLPAFEAHPWLGYNSKKRFTVSEVILCLLWFVRALGLAKKLASLAEPISTRELKQLSRPYTRFPALSSTSHFCLVH